MTTQYAYVTTVVTTKRTYVMSKDDLQKFNSNGTPTLAWALDTIVMEEAGDFVVKEEYLNETIVDSHWLDEPQLAYVFKKEVKNG